MRRREWLRLAGAGAGASVLPLLGGPLGGRARGGVPEIPKRIVFVFNQEGMLLGDAEPRPLAGASSYDSTSFAFSRCMQPLEPLKNDMLLFENLDMISQHYDPIDGANAHLTGETHALTGANRYNGELAGATSIDQYIAQQINRDGPLTALNSLEVVCSPDMAYNDGFRGPRKIPSTSGPGEQVDALGRPEEIFDRAFPPTGSGAMTDVSAALAHQQRIFDFLRGEHGAVAGRLGADERHKLEQHMQLMSDLESRRRMLLEASADRRAFWPDRSMVDPALDLDWSYNADRATVWAERYDIAAPLNMRIVAAALHADVTRVATVFLTPPEPAGLGFRDGDFGATDFHDLVHKTNDPATTQSRDPAARDTVIRVIQGGLDQVRVLGEELARLTEVDGSRLLDHTLVVYTSQIGYGSHDVSYLPWFTIGNIDGYFSPGRLIQFGRVTDAEETWRDNGRPHNDLFVSAANAMGLPITTFGNPEACTGAIAEMRG